MIHSIDDFQHPILGSIAELEGNLSKVGSGQSIGRLGELFQVDITGYFELFQVACEDFLSLNLIRIIEFDDLVNATWPQKGGIEFGDVIDGLGYGDIGVLALEVRED